MSENLQSTAVALGTFDGMHLAHRKVLRNTLQYKKAKSAICVTFSLPPALIKSHKSGLLMQPELKEKELLKMGFEKVITLDFEKVRNMPPEAFLQNLKAKYGAVAFCCGYNYSFGKNGSGNVALMEGFCKNNGVELIAEKPFLLDGELVSSSAIREHIAKGDLEHANRLLGSPLTFVSPVINGDERGRTIGFPTINQELPQMFVPLKFGVYDTTVKVDGKNYKGITNIGIRPTFRLKIPISETYIIGFTGDLYGKEIPVSINKFIRSEKQFSSLEELKIAINNDYKIIKGGDHCDINN